MNNKINDNSNNNSTLERLGRTHSNDRLEQQQQTKTKQNKQEHTQMVLIVKFDFSK